MSSKTHKIRKIAVKTFLLTCLVMATVLASTVSPPTAEAVAPIPAGCPGSKIAGPLSPANKKKCDNEPPGCPGSTKQGPKRDNAVCRFSATANPTSDPTGDPAFCAANPKAKGCGASNSKAYCGINNCDLVEKYINPTINVLSVIFGLIAVISIIAGGIQYSASAGDPQKVTAAKQRISHSLIAVAAFFFLWSFLQFLVPGGLFK